MTIEKRLIVTLVFAVVVQLEEPVDNKLSVREKRGAKKGCRELHFFFSLNNLIVTSKCYHCLKVYLRGRGSDNIDALRKMNDAKQ